MVLTGTGMSATAAENTVMLGATPCQRLIVTKLSTTSPGTATQVSCGVPADTVAGMRKVRGCCQMAFVTAGHPWLTDLDIGTVLVSAAWHAELRQAAQPADATCMHHGTCVRKALAVTLCTGYIQ